MKCVIAGCLLSYRADPLRTDAKGITSVDRASDAGYLLLAEFLKYWPDWLAAQNLRTLCRHSHVLSGGRVQELEATDPPGIKDFPLTARAVLETFLIHPVIASAQERFFQEESSRGAAAPVASLQRVEK